MSRQISCVEKWLIVKYAYMYNRQFNLKFSIHTAGVEQLMSVYNDGA
jgi:hypothetical protein